MQVTNILSDPTPVSDQDLQSASGRIHIGHYSVWTTPSPDNRKPIVPLTRLAKLLPHGSGIDGDWALRVTNHGDIRVYGEFHTMDEWGGYDGWTVFTFRIYRAKRTVYHRLSGPYERQAQILHRKGDILMSPVTVGYKRRSTYGLGEYLDDLLSDALDQFLTPVRSETVPVSEVPEGAEWTK